MRCMAIAAAAFLAVIAPAGAQDSKLKAALTACMTRADRLMAFDAAIFYACEGQSAADLFAAMEMVSDQTMEGDAVTRQAGSIICGRNPTKETSICSIAVVTTVPFAKQVEGRP